MYKSIKKFIGTSVCCASLFACGYQAPTTAEIYDPANHPDHKIDLASVNDVVEIYQIMKDTDEVFSRCNVEYWAEGGTALGETRNKGFIPWDDDNDTMMPESQIKNLLALRPIFTQLGYFIEKVFFGYRIVKPETTAQVDIFVMKEENNRFYYSAGDWGRRNGDRLFIQKDEVYPIRRANFGPIQIMTANNPKPYFDAMFKGWDKVAFTYGHAGQRKFKIDLDQYPEFRQAGPLNPSDLLPIDVRDRIRNRIPSDLKCPQIPDRAPTPVRHYFDGV